MHANWNTAKQALSFKPQNSQLTSRLRPQQCLIILLQPLEGILHRLLDPRDNIPNVRLGAIIRRADEDMITRDAVLGAHSRVQADAELVQADGVHGVGDVFGAREGLFCTLVGDEFELFVLREIFSIWECWKRLEG